MNRIAGGFARRRTLDAAADGSRLLWHRHGHHHLILRGRTRVNHVDAIRRLLANGHGVYDLLVSYRSGDVWAPKVEQTEALKLELGYFVECIRSNKAPFNDGVAGLRVVKILEAADRSLKDRGRAIQL